MPTNNKGLNQPILGSVGWGTPINENASILDLALGAFEIVAGTSGTVSLSATQVQSMCLKSDTAAFTSNVTFSVPSGVAGQWVVVNQSASNTFNLIVKNAASETSVSIPNGRTRAVYSDGSIVFFVDTQTPELSFTPVQQGGGTGQLGNKLYLGWTGSEVAIQVDSTSQGGIALKSDVSAANSSLVKSALNATGAEPIYACRAWVNFNGQGVPAIRASGNVSSITDNGVGQYTVNFSTAMQDANYSAVVSASRSTSAGLAGISTTRSASSTQVFSYSNTDFQDMVQVNVAIFR